MALDERTKPSHAHPGSRDIGASDDSALPMDDSSQPMNADSGSRSGSRGQPTSVSAAGADAETTLSARSATDDSGATGTGGFDTMLGQIVVESGLVTPEELELCNAIMTESGTPIEASVLADLLLQNDFVTKRQLERLRSDFEAKKSSQRIPGYRIKRKVGAGAMATVFLARQLSLDRHVAIKVLPKKFSDNANFIERFYKEGRAAAQLNHPNIVQAYDVGQAGEHHYFVMEFVDGPTVYDLLVKEKRLGEKHSIKMVRQVAEALKHAHEKGFIHRDIKPKNIMITSTGIVKLADLGLARAMSDKDAAQAEAGRAYGTPYYISPEQIRGEVKIGPRADIYGLGATFYHMVTGRVPFEGKNPSEVMHRHLKTPLPPPDHLNPKLSAGCAQVIEMMMAKHPSERYQSVDDLIQDLDLIARGQPPHFARRELNITEIATDIAAAPTAPVEIPKHQPAPGSGGTSGTAFIIVVVMLAFSVIGNVLLLVMALSS